MKDFFLFLRRWLPVGLWAGFVIYASTGVGSGDSTAHFLRPCLKWIWPDLGLALIPEINFMIRKAAHVVQFAVYASLLWRGLRLDPPLAVRTRALAWVLASSAALAFLSEGLQLFYPQRTSQLTDVGLDFLGSVIGSALILAIGVLARRCCPSKSLPPAAGTAAG